MKRTSRIRLRIRARWRATNGYFKFGCIATAVLVAVAALLAFGEDVKQQEPRWLVFWHASPNEIGDAIAGIAGALAFLWIIVTVLIQGSELRLQRRELAMTRRELKAQRQASEKMATAQDAQVRALESQAAIFEDERVRRNEERMKEILDGLLNTLRGFLQNSFSIDCCWVYVVELFGDGTENRRKSTLFQNADSRKSSIELPEVDFFRQLLVRLRGILEVISHHENKGTLREKPNASAFTPMISTLVQISELSEKLSLGQQYRLSAIGFEDLKKVLRALASKADEDSTL